MAERQDPHSSNENHLERVIGLLHRHELVQNLVQREGGERQALVENLVHRQHLNELQALLERQRLQHVRDVGRMQPVE